MVTFQNEFEKSSYKERLAFKNFIKSQGVDILTDKKHTIGITPHEGKDKYDVSIKEIQDNGHHHHIFIELKIRNLKENDLEQARKDGFFYETKKHKDLMYLKSLMPEMVKIKYINFTPDGTYIWDIDDLVEKNLLKSIKRYMNKTTSVYVGKENKTVYQLKTDWATKYDYVWSEEQFDKHIKEIHEIEVEELNRNNKKPNIGFEI